MAQRTTRTELSPYELTDDTDNDQDERPPDVLTKKNSIKHYVKNMLHRHNRDDEQHIDLTQAQILIDPTTDLHHGYENVSAFRQYHSNADGITRTGAQRRYEEDLMSEDDDFRRNRPTADQSVTFDESLGELNLDPNPRVEERDGGEKRYKQKVYLRQLQPPTPQPVEIQVQEVLLEGQKAKPPLHVRVTQREPRTPSPIVIKSAPPQPPPIEPDQPIVYNKYVPPPKQPPQQIIIHRHSDLPPKPPPIVVEQWLPYKPAPKRIIKHSLPPEAFQTPPAPHNLLVSYAKPRALIEVELVRLPTVKIDPYTYQQMNIGGPQQLSQHPPFQHERDYFSRDTLARASQPAGQFNWRI